MLWNISRNSILMCYKKKHEAIAFILKLCLFYTDSSIYCISWLYEILMADYGLIQTCCVLQCSETKGWQWAVMWGYGGQPQKQGSCGQQGAHLGPVVPRWAPCWPHEPCYLGQFWLFVMGGWNLMTDLYTSLGAVWWILQRGSITVMSVMQSFDDFFAGTSKISGQNRTGFSQLLRNIWNSYLL